MSRIMQQKDFLGKSGSHYSFQTLFLLTWLNPVLFPRLQQSEDYMLAETIRCIRKRKNQQKEERKNKKKKQPDEKSPTASANVEPEHEPRQQPRQLEEETPLEQPQQQPQ
ncbi:hypothetical protein PIB30_086586 [Stylosanthes scabra]|uniref:Uncharacterized protein n=1 Tax=Stylosanthes scabra TaxID=79078 RepID=A0ABU6WUF0_9FABA|nr:hypothetical protein [Stylosanthes scabra]